MTQKDPSKKNNKKNHKKRDWSFYAIIICLILMAIPAVFVGVNALIARGNAGVPILGRRFDGDLDPAITPAQLETLKTNMGAVEGVQKATVALETATVRINLVTATDTTKAQMESIANAAYDSLLKTLPVETYFTATETKKMYDLEFNVVNMSNPTPEQRESFMYLLQSKTSNETEKRQQFVSEPLSPDYVQELKDAQAQEDANSNNAEGSSSQNNGTE